ncbi:sulfotransferase domain-containing protein [Rhodophyticola sp.]|uniref:sulfotransferase domain-containing protein n=1 Tax=Rhodophyticola sp. TaxID=2680032 RepID=UPI003D2B0AD1
MKPIVLTRNIFDACVSLRDHMRNESSVGPMAFAPSDISAASDSELELFIAHHVAPWYFNFFLSWESVDNKISIGYEDLRLNPEQKIQGVLEFFNFPASSNDIDRAVEKALKGKIRKNIGVSGRGMNLNPHAREHILRLSSHYPNQDFSALGISN